MNSSLLRSKGLSLKVEAIVQDSDRFWKPELSPDQRSCCEEAVRRLRLKLAEPRLLDVEFTTLGVPFVNAAKKFQAAKVNAQRNRYLDVLPFDDTRVVLQPRGGSSDYINASFIEATQAGFPKFIATQGPLRSTTIDFWEMVMQYRCPVIVMLTRILDGRQEKCAPYFPFERGQTQSFGRLLVTNKGLVASSYGLVKRLFEVQVTEEGGEPPVNVLHIEYLDWPDLGVPASTRPIREVFRCLNQIDVDAGPFIVHCSAGIGRSGTYITIDYALRRILNGDFSAVNLQDIVRHLRLQRVGMVQVKAQYQFCHKVIADELEDILALNTAVQ